MSADAWSLLAVLAILAAAGWVMFRTERKLAKVNDLGTRNNYAQVVYSEAGMRWYPHKLADGTVRWYDVEHDPMDV